MELPKKESTKIISITSHQNYIVGLGEDNFLYYWSAEKHTWYTLGFGEVGKVIVQYNNV